MPFIQTRRPVTVVNTVEGYWSGANRKIADSYIVNHGLSSKATPVVKSNKVLPTEWARVESWVAADNPHKVFVKDHTGYWTDTRYFSPSEPDPSFWGKPSGFQARANNASAKVMTTVRSRLRSSNTFNVGVSVAEARATAEMLGDTAGSMGTALKNFRRYVGTLPTSARGRALALAGAWLQGYYGWGSLARDGFDLNNKLRSKMDEPLTIFSTATEKTEMSGNSHSSYVQVDWEAQEIARAKIMATIANGFARDMDSWGLSNPATIAWELSPFSFVIDWVMPIGNILDSLSAVAGLNFGYGYASTTYESSSKKRRTPSSNIVDVGLYHHRVKSFNRVVMGNFPLPDLYANENPFSTPRIISGAALLMQGILGGK